MRKNKALISIVIILGLIIILGLGALIFGLYEKAKDPSFSFFKQTALTNNLATGTTNNIVEKNIKIDEKLAKFFVALKNINSKLWIIEDDKRKCEKDSNFGEDFIRLSRDVHFLNDTRAKIKLDINNHTGSKIKEIKEYTGY